MESRCIPKSRKIARNVRAVAIRSGSNWDDGSSDLRIFRDHDERNDHKNYDIRGVHGIRGVRS